MTSTPDNRLIDATSLTFALRDKLSNRAASWAAVEISKAWGLPFNGGRAQKHKEHIAKYGPQGSDKARAVVEHCVKLRKPRTLERFAKQLETFADRPRGDGMVERKVEAYIIAKDGWTGEAGGFALVPMSVYCGHSDDSSLAAPAAELLDFTQLQEFMCHCPGANGDTLIWFRPAGDMRVGDGFGITK